MTSLKPHLKVHLGAASTKENMNKSLLSPTRINLAVRILTSSYVAVTLLGVLHQRVTEAGTRGSFPPPAGTALCLCLPCHDTLEYSPVEPLRSVWLCLAGSPILGWYICMGGHRLT